MDVQRALVDSAKGALYFLALGPPVGALAMTLAMAIGLFLAVGPPMLWDSPSTTVATLGGLASVAFVTALFSWVLGAVPALVTGALLGPWRGHFRQWRWCLVAGVVGAAAAVAFFQLSGPGGGEGGGVGLVLYCLVPGFTAGMLVAKVFAIRAPHPPPKRPPPHWPAGIGDSP